MSCAQCHGACPEGRKKFCSRRCSNASYRSRRRVRNRNRLSQLKSDRGGACERCGYDDCLAALALHHRDSQDKLFELSAGRDKSDHEFFVEAGKCDMLCMNCHIVVHQGDGSPYIPDLRR